MKAFKLIIIALCIHLSLQAQPVTSGNETMVNTTTVNSQQNPAVAMDANGNYVAVWESYGTDGSGYGIYFQRYDALGVAQGNQTKVNSTTANDQRFPDIAIDATGKFTIVWQSDIQDGSGLGIYAAMFNANGTSAKSEFIINTTTADEQRQPSIAMEDNGAFVVAWASPDADKYGIVARVYNSTGTAQTAEIAVNSTTTDNQSFPDVAMDNTGNFAITWQSLNQDGSGNGIYFQRYNAAGTAQGSETKANTTTTNNQQNPTIGMEQNGGFAIAWESYGQDKVNTTGIYHQRFAATGTTIGNESQVNTTTTNHQSEPNIAMDAAGNYYIAWSSYATDGSFYGVYLQAYNDLGEAYGGEIIVNTRTQDFQQNPAIAVEASTQKIAIVWQDGLKNSSNTHDGDDYGVYSQRYVILPPVYVKKTASGANDGSSWANAFNNLQDAIDALPEGGQVWVAADTYFPTKEKDGTTDSPTDFTFYIKVNDLKIYGGFAGTEAELSERNALTNLTVLSGDLGVLNDKTDNAYTIVEIDATTANGNITSSTVLDGFTIQDGFANYNNGIFNAGGIYNNGSGSDNICNPIIANCTFVGNEGLYGGAMYNYGNGGESSPTITNCTFKSNTNPFNTGGAIYNYGQSGVSSPTIVNSVFYANTASEGGAVFNDGLDGVCSPSFINCTFASNTAGSKGSVMSSTGVASSVSKPTLTNCLIWSNGSNAISNGANVAMTIHYSIYDDGTQDGVVHLPSGTSGSNNIEQDPLFGDLPIGDLRINTSSPAIDAGDGASHISLNTRSLDLSGNARFNGVIDIGAYESDGNSLTPLPVELLYFYAEKEGENVRLDWQTATELNNSHFDVEWSTDGINFERISQVQGAGTTNNVQFYTSLHTSPAQGLNYYRLKQVDLPTGQAGFDEKYEYTDILSVNYELGITNYGLKIFPNPASNFITIDGIEEGEIVQVFNVNGQLVKTFYQNVSTQQTDVSDLPSGTYFVKIGKQVKKLIITQS